MSDPLSHALQPGFRLERHGPLAELVLDRPARHNAFDADLMLGLLDCFDELAHTHGQALADRPHALLLRAEGKRDAELAQLRKVVAELREFFLHLCVAQRDRRTEAAGELCRRKAADARTDDEHVFLVPIQLHDKSPRIYKKI